jgi:hypothetical protein
MPTNLSGGRLASHLEIGQVFYVFSKFVMQGASNDTLFVLCELQIRDSTQMKARFRFFPSAVAFNLMPEEALLKQKYVTSPCLFSSRKNIGTEH